MKKVDLMVIGVGGQGIILSSDIIGEAALAEGYDVKKTDTLGMAQRGGSVVSHMRLAPEVWSPLAQEGKVDLILAFEKLEAVRWGYYLRPGGIVIVNNQALPPLAVSLGEERYPGDEEIIAALKQGTDRVYFVDGTRRAMELGNVKTLNIFMLGCISLFMPLKLSTWKASIGQHLPAGLHQINLAAFEQGRKEIRSVRGG